MLNCTTGNKISNKIFVFKFYQRKLCVQGAAVPSHTISSNTCTDKYATVNAIPYICYTI